LHENLIPGASWADLIKVKTGFYSSNPRYKGFFHGLELYFIRDSPFGFTFYFIGDSVDRKFTSYRILSLFWSKPKVKTQFHRMRLESPGPPEQILLRSRPGFTALTQDTESSFHGLELYFIRDSPFGFTFYFIEDSVDRKFTSYRILSLFWSKPKVKTQFHCMKLDLLGPPGQILLRSRPGFHSSNPRYKELFSWIGTLLHTGFSFWIHILLHRGFCGSEIYFIQDSEPFLVETQSQNPVSSHET
jgi:hypothetical protein